MILNCVFFVFFAEEGASGPGAVAGGSDVGLDHIDLFSHFWFVVVEFVVESERMFE